MNVQELRTLLQKLNNHLIKTLDTATGLGLKMGHDRITMDHLLVALLEDGRGDIMFILKHFTVDAGEVVKICRANLEKYVPERLGKPSLSTMLTQLFEQAWMTSSVQHNEAKIRSGALFEAFIASEWLLSTGLMDVCEPIIREELKNRFHDMVRGSIEDSSTLEETVSAKDAKEAGAGDGSVLGLYTNNLTAQAKEGKIDPILGRDDEILQMIEILCRRKKSNPILLGEPGVGKTAVVEGLALKVAQNQVPDLLRDVQILALDLGALQAGTKMRGEFEQRFKAVINGISHSVKPSILFIDEAHTLIGAGGTQGSGDAANLLKPALARSEIRAIAATTYTEYNKYFAKDAALERRFQPVHVGEPDDDKAVLMMRGIKTKYEAFHGIHITDQALEAAVKLSRRYIAGRQLPDKAIDLLDTSATRVKMSLTNVPPGLELEKNRLNAIQLQISTLSHDLDLGIDQFENKIAMLKEQASAMEKDIDKRQADWKQEGALVAKLMDLRKQKAANQKSVTTAQLEQITRDLAAIQGETPQIFADVTTNTVAQVIESWTGIPVSRMTRDESTSLLQLGEELKKQIIGQDHAIEQVVNTIRSAKQRLNKEEGPIGVFLLVGPSGVGKTELARVVAMTLFGDEHHMVVLNMTEYQNEYNTSRLIGADPGLVGYGEGGALSEPVRRRPYCVVLLDEMEKANLSVKDLFMQVFDKGMLKDAERRDINFNNTIIFMTSNLASEVIMENFQQGMRSPDELLDLMRPYLNQHFRSEFLGRVKPIIFLPLETEVMKKIVELKIKKLAGRLQKNQNLQLECAPQVIDQITASCTRAEIGARNIDAVIDRHIVPEISGKLLAFMAEQKSVTRLKIGLSESGEYQYQFE